MLSKEVPVQQSARNAALQSEEVNWSLGTYTPLKEVEKKFNVNLPSPHTVAPNQPWKNGKIYGYWAAFMVVAMFAGVFMFVSAPRTKIFSQTCTLKPQASPHARPRRGRQREDAGGLHRPFGASRRPEHTRHWLRER